jgi:hypothetical protein
MLIRNNPWQLLNDLNSLLDTSFRPRVPDESNVENELLPLTLRYSGSFLVQHRKRSATPQLGQFLTGNFFERPI